MWPSDCTQVKEVTCWIETRERSFLLACCALHAQPVGSKITLHFPLFVSLCIPTYHVRMYSVAMQLYFSQLQMAAFSTLYYEQSMSLRYAMM